MARSAAPTPVEKYALKQMEMSTSAGPESCLPTLFLFAFPAERLRPGERRTGRSLLLPQAPRPRKLQWSGYAAPKVASPGASPRDATGGIHVPKSGAISRARFRCSKTERFLETPPRDLHSNLGGLLSDPGPLLRLRIGSAKWRQEFRTSKAQDTQRRI